jgi:hypothetical protein
VAIGAFTFPYFHHFPELNQGINQMKLRVLALLRPSITGERTEIKLLFGKEPGLIFLRELFQASKRHGVYRYSFRRPSEKNVRKFEETARRFDRRLH